MAIRFKDFFPEVKSQGIFSTEYATLRETVARANAWIEEKGAKVLNAETVVLPNVGTDQETTAIGIRTSGDMSSWWYQVIRVWYTVEA
jgi:hypothetical protein